MPRGRSYDTRNKNEQATDHLLLAKPDLRTSRRNFIAAASTLATAGLVLGAGFVSKARADASEQGLQKVQITRRPGAFPRTCVSSGNRIATLHKEVPIDELRIGDLVMSVSGEPKPIKWIRRNHYTRIASEAWSSDLLPVRVAKFALNDHTPHADLYLSPGHALYLHGLLIPVVGSATAGALLRTACKFPRARLLPH